MLNGILTCVRWTAAACSSLTALHYGRLMGRYMVNPNQNANDKREINRLHEQHLDRKKGGSQSQLELGTEILNYQSRQVFKTALQTGLFAYSAYGLATGDFELPLLQCTAGIYACYDNAPKLYAAYQAADAAYQARKKPRPD